MKKLLTTLALTITLTIPHTASAAATPTSCPQYEALLKKNAPKGGWDVKLMSRYMARESRCHPTARSRTSDSGLLQINDINLPFLSRVLKQKVTSKALMNPTLNVRAAAALCNYWRSGLKFSNACYIPWQPIKKKPVKLTLTGSR
jgi:soluble lytic murein transglycosylase-like protein